MSDMAEKTTDSAGRKRIAKGVPTAGEFASNDRDEAPTGVLSRRGTLFGGIALSQVRDIAEKLSVRDLSDGDAIDVYARAALTAMAEPDDRHLGTLVSRHGAARILEDVTAGRHDLLVADAEDEPVADRLIHHLSTFKQKDVAAALEAGAALGATVATPDDTDWPEGLDDLGEHAPHALWVRGNRELLTRTDKAVAFAGSTDVDGYGTDTSYAFARQLGSLYGGVVIGGGQYGVEEWATRGAVNIEMPSITIQASGLDKDYPESLGELRRQARENGGVTVSELAPGVAATKWRMMSRHRVFAAMSSGVLVPQTGHRSAALHTVGQALALGRPVGVIPGPVNTAASAGSNALLRDGAGFAVVDFTDLTKLFRS